MRAFIAIRLPEDTRAALQRFGESLKKKGAHATWVKPEVMHLTLRFLGDITEEQAAHICVRLRGSSAQIPAPTLLVRGIGAFPSLRRPSVLWAGVENDLGGLDAAWRAANEAVAAAGLAPDTKAFHGHVTLARIRKGDRVEGVVQALAPFLAAGMTPQFGHEFKAANMVLFSSTLTRQGPIHRPIEEFMFQ